MTLPDFDTMIMLERRRNDLAAAEHSRLVKTALQARSGQRSHRLAFRPGAFIQSALHLAGQGLYQAGIRIQMWGCRLQVRYAAGIAGSQGAPCD